MKKLAGRVAVVTGGASGIGLGMAEAFASVGMNVVVVDLDEARLEQAVARIRAAGAPEVFATRVDVRDADAVVGVARQTVKRFGAAHVLCNNAGVSAIGYQWLTPLEDWKWVLDVNLFGVVHGIHAFMPTLLEQDEAHVVNTASMAGLAASPGMGAYAASKHAVVGLSKALRADLATRWPHVGVSVVCPGEVATNLADNVRTLGRPQDLAHVEALRVQLAGAMSPRRVGDLVVDAVTTRSFWVLPGGATYLGPVADEMDAIRASANRIDR